MKISKKEVEHIAGLSRLELSEEEKAKYAEDLSAVVEHIDELKEADTEGVEPTAQVSGKVNSLRQDKAEDWDEAEKQAALSLADRDEDGHIKVNKILKQ